MMPDSAAEFTALYSGTFDPIHRGHLAVASYIASLQGCRDVFLSVSPRNPLKQGSEISPDEFRLRMAEAAIEGMDGIKITDIEMRLPRPSYSLAVLEALSAAYPDRNFRLVIGADNWLTFSRWKNPEEIITRFGVIVCPRPGYAVGIPHGQEEKETVYLMPGAIYLPHAPLNDISSTEIRRRLSAGEEIGSLVTPPVEQILRTSS